MHETQLHPLEKKKNHKHRAPCACLNSTKLSHPFALESFTVFGRNLPCQPVSGVNTREAYHWSHAQQRRFKRRKDANLNGKGELQTELYEKQAPYTSSRVAICKTAAGRCAIPLLHTGLHSASSPITQTWAELFAFRVVA